MNSSVPVLCADPKHPGTVSWGCDSLTVTPTGGSNLDAGPSTSPSGSALSHLPPGLGSPGSELPAQHPRREGWMKQQPQEILLNLSQQPQSLLWLCDPFSLLLWGFLTLFSCCPTGPSSLLALSPSGDLADEQGKVSAVPSSFLRGIRELGRQSNPSSATAPALRHRLPPVAPSEHHWKSCGTVLCLPPLSPLSPHHSLMEAVNLLQLRLPSHISD